MQDLVVLAADKQIQFAMRGALARPQALGIRPITYDFRTHPGRDGGVRSTGAAVLAGDSGRFAHALMILDLEGSGRDADDPVVLEAELDAQLRPRWGPRAKAIVIDPEVEIWLWGGEVALREALGWSIRDSIHDWLRDTGFAFGPDEKPQRPKEAMEAIRRLQRQPRSAALYAKITGRISLAKCKDAGFHRLRAQLQAWFGATP